MVGKSQSEAYRPVIYRLEDYMHEHTVLIRNSRDESQINKDLACLMEVVIYDEIQRLERLERSV